MRLGGILLRLDHQPAAVAEPRQLGEHRGEGDAVLAGVFTVPGDGCVDYPGVFEALAAVGYRGWLVVEAEQDPAKAHPLTYARMGHAYLRPLAVRMFAAAA